MGIETVQLLSDRSEESVRIRFRSNEREHVWLRVLGVRDVHDRLKRSTSSVVLNHVRHNTHNRQPRAQSLAWY